MSLFGSLYTSAGGMLAQSRSTSVISNNIANFTTVGFKRDDVAFNDLVGGNGRYSNSTGSGAGANQIQRVREQGNIQQTSSATDMGIIGDGFFAVRKNASGDGDLLYTRAGQFSEDANNILRNTAGYVLYGFTTDTSGVAQGSDAGSLVPIDLGIFQTQFFETDTIDMAINLDSSDDRIDPHASTVPQQLPISDLGASYSREVTVYDDTGAAHDITFSFRKTIGPMAHFTSDTGAPIKRDSILVDSVTSPTSAITNGDQFVVTDGTDTLTVDFVNTAADKSLNQAQTMDDLLDVINGFTDVNGEKIFLASLSERSELLVQAINPTSTLDITASSANVLGANGFNFIQDPDAAPDYIYEPDFDITSTPTATDAYPNQADFPAIADVTTPNPYSWWEITATVDDSLGTPTVITSGLMNFDGNGSPNATADANGDLILTLSPDDLPFSSTAGITVDMSRMTQQSGIYQTISVDQNGAPSGDRRGVSISTDGTVYLKFNNDITLPVYKIPLALFSNPDGLERVDGTAYRVPNDGLSGDPTFAAAQSEGAGTINGSTLESSTVDIANEFGGLIVTQRTYSLNSQVIEAINEMAQNLSRLKG